MLDGTAYTAAPFRVIELSGDDLALMRGANQLFGDAFEDIDRYHAMPPSDDHLHQLLVSPHFIALVACESDTVIGAITAYELVKYEQDAREIYLYDLAVDEHHRRQGVATELIEHLRFIAARRDAEVVFVQADGDDLEAIALYQRFSQQRAVYHFDIEPMPSPRDDR